MSSKLSRREVVALGGWMEANFGESRKATATDAYLTASAEKALGFPIKRSQFAALRRDMGIGAHRGAYGTTRMATVQRRLDRLEGAMAKVLRNLDLASAMDDMELLELESLTSVTSLK